MYTVIGWLGWLVQSAKQAERQGPAVASPAPPSASPLLCGAQAHRRRRSGNTATSASFPPCVPALPTPTHAHVCEDVRLHDQARHRLVADAVPEHLAALQRNLRVVVPAESTGSRQQLGWVGLGG